MDHGKALNQQSAERYLLGEMSAAEADEFERHYFECQECALAVEEGQTWVANARAVLAEEEPEAVRQLSPERPRDSLRDSSWIRWRGPALIFATAASVLLGALALYQGTVVIPGLQHQSDEARVLPAFQLIGASRGAATHITVPAGTPSFALAADVPPDVHFLQYACELSIGGRALFRLSAPAPAEGQPITLLVPAISLKAGEYELAIYGVDSAGQPRDRISTFAFTLEYH